MRALSFLFWQWLRRELLGRYRGSWIGMGWAVIQPLAQILVFTLIFHNFLNVRWPGASEAGSAIDYGLNVFVGLVVFNCVAEVLSRSPAVILAQPSLVTKVRFPSVILPAVVVGVALVHLVIGIVLVGVGAGLFRQIHWTILLLPAYALPLALYALALAWGLSALGVYLRDIGQVLPSVTSLLMFLTPIFYPASAVPAGLRFLLDYNPLSWAVETFRALLLAGAMPPTGPVLMHAAVATVLALLAFRTFRHLSEGFADVL